MLFNGFYWLASRCSDNYPIHANFSVHNVRNVSDVDYGVSSDNMCSSGVDGVYADKTKDICAVRPIVTLKSDSIDISTNYSVEGKWKLK